MKNEILSLIQNNDGTINTHFKKILKTHKDIYDKILLYYDDSTSLTEAVYRIINNLDERPKCPVCGKKLKFYGFSTGFAKSCSIRCAQYNIETQQKIKETCLKRYGETNAMKNKQIYNKAKNTIIKKYGVDNVSKSDIIKQKKVETCLNNYGVKYALHLPDVKEKASKNSHTKEVRDKAKNTIIKKYGVDNVSKSDIIKQKKVETCLNNYGVKYPMQSNIVQNKSMQSCLNIYGCKSISQVYSIKQKKIETMRLHNSFCISKPENKILNILLNKYNDTCYQYSSDLYPFHCDFYIPSLNLYIEYNGSWTHGKHPFNKDNEDDIEILNNWKIKSETSKFYKSAIETWTIRDVNKRNLAYKNKLNFIEIWYVYKNYHIIGYYQGKYIDTVMPQLFDRHEMIQ